jgi:L-fuculose-phosphate aldolase
MLHEHAARLSMAAAGARLGARGLIVAAEGNFSIRLGSTILVSPAGRRKDELEPDDMVLVPLERPGDGPDAPDAFGRRPSSDVATHRAIYLARPDVMAIVHAHVASSLALTTAGLAPDPADLPETQLFLPRLPILPLLPMGSPALTAAVAAAMSDRGTSGEEPLPGAVLLERHGPIAVGPDIQTAGNRIELVDLLCRVRMDVAMLRAALQSGADR